MVGKPDTGLLNAMAAEERSYGEWLEMGEQIASLCEHRGWELVQEYVEATRLSGMERLIGTGKVLDQAEYAQRLAHLDGLSYAADVAASILERARLARAELEASARLEQAASEGS